MSNPDNMNTLSTEQSVDSSVANEVTEESSELRCDNWDDFELKIDLLRGIYGMGFEKPSSIQQKAIKPMLSKRDIIAQAQSGTGKTGTFSIGTLQMVDASSPHVQAILVSPTHELAHQTSTVIKNIGAMMDGLFVQTLVGGTSIREDLDTIKNSHPQIIVGTPGRIYDMMKREHLDTSHVKVIVLDEADDMLSKGFKDQIYNIFQYLPESVQVALFSATMPDEMHDLTLKFMRNPIKIVMKTEELNLECIKQYYVAVRNDGEKYGLLKHLFEQITMSQCIIYVNSIKRVIDLYNAMIQEGYSVCCIHGSMTKQERDESFKNFKKGLFRVLISSNITSRGIDIQQVSIVINFDIPNCVHNYLHRIGRSGRWGRKGIAINFVTKHDLDGMRRIERHYKSNIEELPEGINIQNMI